MGDAAADVVHGTLNSSSTLGDRVVAKVRSVKGVEKVSTGVITVTDVGVSKPGVNLEHPMMNRLSVSVPAGILIAGVVLCALGCIAVAVKAITTKQRPTSTQTTYKM